MKCAIVFNSYPNWERDDIFVDLGKAYFTFYNKNLYDQC